VKAGTVLTTLNAEIDSSLGVSMSGAYPTPKYRLDIHTSPVTVSKFGNSDALYVGKGLLGFNTYYNGGWKYGFGSTTSFGDFISHTPGTGELDFSISTAGGAQDSTMANNTRMRMFHGGVVTIGGAASDSLDSLFYVKGSSHTSGNALFDKNVTVRHLSSITTTPTYTAGTGAGTAPTITVTGTDLSGNVSVLTGAAPAGTNATIVTITFNSAYGTAPYVILQPANALTALLSGVSGVYVTSGTGTFLIVSGSTALTTLTTYSWNYTVVQ
jgi:hypothetical protein